MKNIDLLNIINNLNSTGNISSCIIYKEDIGAGKIKEIIKIKRRNDEDYELIFEKEILTTYTRNIKNEIVANDF